MKNVFAHTLAHDASYPGYISVNTSSDNTGLAITVRTDRTTDGAGIQLPEAEAVAMARAILAHYMPAVETPKQEAAGDPIRAAVDRFLCWRLPEDFAPDGGISLKRSKTHEISPPIGTNLLTATQAEAMFRYCLGGE